MRVTTRSWFRYIVGALLLTNVSKQSNAGMLLEIGIAPRTFRCFICALVVQTPNHQAHPFCLSATRHRATSTYYALSK